MDLNLWVLTFLIIFMLHNLEEIITIEKWIQKTYPRVSRMIPLFVQKELKKYKDITSAKFAVVVFVFSVFTSILILIAVITQHYYLFLGVNLLFAINIFTHPLQALYLRCYTPGVLTSFLLIIPYYSLFFYQFKNTDILTLSSIVGAIVVMVFLIPVFFISHKIGEKWS
ncbi:HXXEE domain-containing protein [Oceanobacillus kapialis]|uniref:HXXEE domain-containing protein n=1 Tax=Oceanobacillus kapialis TaxID=481353 RepID=A0ABW5PWF7_9BACI